MNEGLPEELSMDFLTEFFRVISKNPLIGVAIASPLGTFMYSNQAITKITGFSEEELASWGPIEFSKIIHADDISKVNQRMRLVTEGKRDVQGPVSVRIHTKSNELKKISYYPVAIKYCGEDCFLLAIIDISEMER